MIVRVVERWAPFVCAVLPFLVLIFVAHIKHWIDVNQILNQTFGWLKMEYSKTAKFTFKKKEVKVTSSEVIELDSDLEDFDLLTSDNTDSDNDFKKSKSSSRSSSQPAGAVTNNRRKQDEENWKKFMEEARKPKLTPEKRKEAQDQWKGLMSTMQKNQQKACTEDSKKKNVKRQISTNNKKPLTNPVTKKLKVGAQKVITIEETDIVIESQSSNKVDPSAVKEEYSKPIHPIFMKAPPKVDLPVGNEENEVKPWDLVHTENPWLCDSKSFAEPEVVSLNENTAPIALERGETAKTKTCPFYKKIPGTKFSVDAFNYGVIPGIDVYLLSHFHSDHYIGLTKKFNKTVICSIPTGNLVKMKLGVNDECIRKLELNKVYIIQGIEVVLIDANHCPGSVLFLLKLQDGTTYLHTGDFRFTTEMLTNRFLQGLRVDCLYLDTTYCDPRYTFPTQAEAISHAISEIKKHIAYRPKTLVVCGTYCIGKERVFCAIADALGSKVFCGYEKRRVIGAIENPYFQNLLSNQEHQCRVHVLSMQNLNAQFLTEYLTQRGEYTNIFAVRPTGWEFSKGGKSTKAGANLRSMCNDTVTVLGIPYSEHSSFSELRQFVSTVKPLRVQPTVNVGNANKRESMMTYIDSWLASSS